MKPTWCTIYSQYISLILFMTSTCLGTLQVHHQEEQLYLCDTWYLLFCIAGCLVCRMEFHPAYQTVSLMMDLERSETCRGYKSNWRNMLRIKSCTKLVSFTGLCRDARSTEHKTEFCFIYRT